MKKKHTSSGRLGLPRSIARGRTEDPVEEKMSVYLRQARTTIPMPK